MKCSCHFDIFLPKIKIWCFSLTARYVKDVILIGVLTFRKIQCTKSLNLLEEWYKYVNIIFFIAIITYLKNISPWKELR